MKNVKKIVDIVLFIIRLLLNLKKSQNHGKN